MNVLVAYDVNTLSKDGQKRLRRVAKACLDYGQRVQNSVFECCVSEANLAILINRLKEILKHDEDSIRIYYLSKTPSRATIVLGRETSYNPEGFLMI